MVREVKIQILFILVAIFISFQMEPGGSIMPGTCSSPTTMLILKIEPLFVLLLAGGMTCHRPPRNVSSANMQPETTDVLDLSAVVDTPGVLMVVEVVVLETISVLETAIGCLKLIFVFLSHVSKYFSILGKHLLNRNILQCQLFRNIITSH